MEIKVDWNARDWKRATQARYERENIYHRTYSYIKPFPMKNNKLLTMYYRVVNYILTVWALQKSTLTKEVLIRHKLRNQIQHKPRMFNTAI